jgi:hypothetical protein
MSSNSKPSTFCHLLASKISETPLPLMGRTIASGERPGYS